MRMILAKAVSYCIDEDYDESARVWCKMTSKFPTNVGIDKSECLESSVCIMNEHKCSIFLCWMHKGVFFNTLIRRNVEILNS